VGEQAMEPDGDPVSGHCVQDDREQDVPCKDLAAEYPNQPERECEQRHEHDHHSDRLRGSLMCRSVSVRLVVRAVRVRSVGWRGEHR
jgi:hypothetical protein